MSCSPVVLRPVLYWTLCTMFVYRISVSVQLIAAIRNNPFIHSFIQTPVYLANDINLTTDGCSDQLPPRHVSSHKHATVSATETPVQWLYRTVCHPTCIRTSATNSLSDPRIHFYSVVNWPRCIVTICLLHFWNIPTNWPTDRPTN